MGKGLENPALLVPKEAKGWGRRAACYQTGMFAKTWSYRYSGSSELGSLAGLARQRLNINGWGSPDYSR